MARKLRNVLGCECLASLGQQCPCFGQLCEDINRRWVLLLLLVEIGVVMEEAECPLELGPEAPLCRVAATGGGRRSAACQHVDGRHVWWW